ncbi:hypothetical protein NQL31_003408 [Lotmaria passim]
MESRRLKRYDSAPISTGASNAASSAAAARAAAHISYIPRPQPSPPPASSTKPMINAAASPSSSSAAAAAAFNRGDDTANASGESYEKQLESYYRCMEEDNQALMAYYEAHTRDIASLKVLVHERKYKEAVFAAMEAKTASMDAFLQEMMDVLAASQGLRTRGDTNIRDTASNASVKSSSHHNSGSAGKAHATTPSPGAAAAATMENVRDGVLKLLAAFQAVSASEERHLLTIQALEEEVAEWKEKAQSRRARAKSGGKGGNNSDADEESDCFLPGTAKELREAQRRVRDLERRLTTATADAKNAAAAVAKLEQQQRVSERTLQRREDELAAMRGLLNSKEQLLATLEEEVKTTRASTVRSRSGEGGGSSSNNNARYVRTNSAPAGAAGAHPHRFGGETSSDRLVVTHHYRLLGGQRFVDGQAFSPESFKDAFLRSVSTLLHIPYGYLTSVEVRTHAEAVSVELDIRHSSRVKEDEIDFLLLSHDYPEVMAYLDKAKAEMAAKTPLDRNAVRVKELQAALLEKEQESDYLRRRLRAAEESVARRDMDRETLDKDMDVALQEAENTVKELYVALQTAQQETEAAQKALAAKALQVRVLEQAKEAAADSADSVVRGYQQEIGKLNEQLAHGQANLAKAKENATQAVLQAQAEAKMELSLALFSFDVPLPTSSAQRAASALLQDAQQTRVLHALALAYAGRTGGAIPLQVKSCALTEATGSTSSENSNSNNGTLAQLQLIVELAFYANKRTSDAVHAEVQRKLKDGGGSCTSVQEYLRMRTEAARKEAAATADAQRAISEAEQRATAAIAAMRAETQHAHKTELEAAASQLQEISARIASVSPGLPDSKSASAPTASTLVVSRVDQLITRLTTAEAASRRHEEEAQRVARRLADAQQEREQLQQTLSELTARCAEVRVAKEQLVSKLAVAESQLKASQATAGEAEMALAEKVRRLESALRSKTAAAEAEKEKAAAELKAAATASARRLAEAEEALAAKEKDMKRLQAKLETSSSGTAASVTCAAAKGSVNEEAALCEALRVAKEERMNLARQVKEMETDMNDLSNIQAAMQRELESAQQELRAKKHDFDLLVKQLIRMEEKEKKWQADQQSQQVLSPDSPSRLQDDDAEKDDVARESLVVLTNSNTNLQQCLRKLQRTMSALGMDASVSAADDAYSSGSIGTGRGTRRSGHRKGALAATVSRAAMDHRQLSTQLCELLVPMLEELENGLKGSAAAAAANNNNGHTVGSGSGIPFARTASCHSNPINGSNSGGAAPRIVKQHLSNSPFARTRSTPVLVEYVSQGTSDAAASQRSTPKPENGGSGSNTDAGATVTGRGGKATVDAAPRLDFHRQNSSRTYVRSNTTTAAATTSSVSHHHHSYNGNSNSGGGAELPPTPGAVAAGGEEEKERHSRELPQRRTGSGASSSNKNTTSVSTAATSGGGAPRRNHPTTTTTKSNPFRRSNTAMASAAAAPSSQQQQQPSSSSPNRAAGNATFMRVNSGYRRLPTANTAEGSGAASTSSTHKPSRMRF